MNTKILIVEDEQAIADNIQYALETEGFETRCLSSGMQVMPLLDREAVDLIILDIGLPDINGLELCKEIRKSYSLPIIFLTARSAEIDRVVGLEIGADDYVVKPFSPRELMARVKAIFRRTSRLPDQHPPELIHQDIQLDLEKRRLRVKNETIPLTPHEYALLEALMAAPGRTFTRDELLDRLYPQGEAVVIERVVDVHIGKLRQKIEPDPGHPRHILTARGIGYRFADPSEPEEPDT